MGTLYMVEMAIKHRADRFILLSDNAACKPTSILGASKRVAEMLIQRANEWGDTRFSAVRFPAAAGNAGGIVQLFNKQIQSGGPVYVSDKSAESYMMTVPEAARLILSAGGMSEGGGEIFSLGIGEPVNLYELAQNMIPAMAYGRIKTSVL
jgi:FlaA1/EpsC-like NDP-sugar epimerase